MYYISSRLPKVIGLLLSLLFLASCGITPAGKEVAPAKEVAPYYVASVKIDGKANQTDIEAQYGGSSILFNPKAGFAILGFSKEQGELTTLATTTNQNAFSNPEIKASGYSAWAGGYSAWAGGWSAWASGQSSVIPPLPVENLESFNQIKLAQAHALSQNYGKGIKVAVIDTGIDLNHPIFQGRLAPANEWKDFVDNDAIPQEGSIDGHAYGHGTAVSGIILQVAPLATILPIRVLGPDGEGDLDHLILAINWAIQMGANVINLSLGTTEYIESLNVSMNYALQNGVYVVAAAGNTGDTHMLYPAASAKVISREYSLMSIGSVNKDDAKSDFSSYGSALEYVAPGEKIFTAYPDNQVAKVTGTSFATPLVSGTLALYMSDSVKISASNNELASSLESTSLNFDDYISRGSDLSLFSDGRLNVAGGYSYITMASPKAQDVSLNLQGSWKRSGGQSATSTSNPNFSFTVTQSGSVSIDLSSILDTYLYLLDASGKVIASNDDGGTGYNSRIVMTLSKGSYTVVAATYSMRQSGSFSLTVSGPVANLK